MKTAGNKQRRTVVWACLAGLCVVLGANVDSAWARPRHTQVLRRVRPVRSLPTYRTVARTIEIPAVYEVRPIEVWHEPVYEERKVLVEVPAETVRREMPRLDRFGRVIWYDTVDEVIRPARKVWRTERVMVRAGYYETVYQETLVRPATTRVVYERVLTGPRKLWEAARLAVHKARRHDVYSRHHGHHRGRHLAVRLRH